MKRLFDAILSVGIHMKPEECYEKFKEHYKEYSGIPYDLFLDGYNEVKRQYVLDNLSRMY